MLRVESRIHVLLLNARQYLQVARLYEEYLSSARSLSANQNALPNEDDVAHILGYFANVQDLCVSMNAPVSARTMEKIIAICRDEPRSYGFTRQKFLEWYAGFESEVETHLYLQVLPHRMPFWSSRSDEMMGAEARKIAMKLDRFPGAAYDIAEAGNCFAYERFTACVYHLMRASEFGLIAVARASNVPEEKINKGWDGCIQGIQSAVNVISSTKPTSNWQSEVKKYSDLCAWLTSIQKGWRNPVSHAPRIYSEDTAKALFSATGTLFSALAAQGFREQTMPAEIPV